MEKGIFALIPENRFRDILLTLHEYTALCIQMTDARGNVLISYGDDVEFCNVVKKELFVDGECDELHLKAGERAKGLGEVYIFTCHCNLNHIAFPLINQGELLGVIIIGPFLMDSPDSTLITSVMQSRALSAATALELYDDLSEMPVIAPTRVNQLSRLVGYLLSPILPDERAQLMRAKERLFQQSRINETIQMYKEQSVPSTHNFFYEKEKILLAKVKTGNTNEVKALLNDLLGYVFFHEGGKLEAVRMRALELTTVLSRVTMDAGARQSVIYDLNTKFFSLMSKEQSLDSICELLQEAVVGFMEAMFDPSASVHVKNAMAYIAANYSSPLTLTVVAEQTGISPTYLSSLFRKSVGVSFREHLNRVRVEEGKILLLSTNDSFADIAIALGFNDQSYFCKVFKRIVGLSPGKFRG